MVYKKTLSLNTVNSSVKNVKYAVRGSIPIQAEVLKTELKKGYKLPFKQITSCNIGNPQQLGQTPITFFRQVLALCEYPDLLSSENINQTKVLFQSDAIERARNIIKHVDSIGSYTHSQGLPFIRENIARFLHERDGYDANPNHIFLTAGASPGVQLTLQAIIQHPKVGIMIPVPQYPLYTASISLFDGLPVTYELQEEKQWGLSVDELKKSLENAKKLTIDVRALCVINPGNPTGQCLSEDNMRQIIEFCHQERLVLLADEVYQNNTYDNQLPFHSFKKVLRSMGKKYDDLELISFHSISKGMIGECGRRGGYFECVGIDQNVIDLFYKIASISLCPPVSGQIAVDLMVNPPKEGDASYATYQKEYNAIYESLKRRAKKLAEAFNSLSGMECQPAQGAMYLFPQIHLPAKAIETARESNMDPDEFYCMELLNATGVCVVPGSGFLQKKGTWHFRCTFLPKEEEIDAFIKKIGEFHEEFMKKYH